ncbi:pyridoxamine 5'-phosphate oxidase family protein [Desulforhopalus vacuolatus]|uniref:pyridoxamine 5'-phosphate oxidase family protein n=1 Tax=Desulforhopalus vacuolatus TaxID=40414 RepID=UPI0019641F37|nr:pyridoxamine 5'-phosphate oxidase family protein [Desulforhopalus vacuolatus]MBM9519336.1 pyridoxamine 5'-phosphate oxidase family protein [Desulforhopalus vacuolatus]
MHDKENDNGAKAEIDAVIRASVVMRLAVVDGDRPWLVPLCFGYDGEKLYFHSSSRKGRKQVILEKNGRVCFEFEDGVQVKAAEKPCNWSFSFRTVIGEGVARELTDDEAKRAALTCIISQYAEEKWAPASLSLKGVQVWEIDIEEISRRYKKQE